MYTSFEMLCKQIKCFIITVFNNTAIIPPLPPYKTGSLSQIYYSLRVVSAHSLFTAQPPSVTCFVSYFFFEPTISTSLGGSATCRVSWPLVDSPSWVFPEFRWTNFFVSFSLKFSSSRKMMLVVSFDRVWNEYPPLCTALQLGVR